MIDRLLFENMVKTLIIGWRRAMLPFHRNGRYLRIVKQRAVLKP
jgi:hypothetical protein